MIKKIIQIIISKAETGLWYDHDKRDYDPQGWGLCIKLFTGSFIRPVPKFWVKDANPWTGDHWFVIRFPFVILPFISIAIGQWGFYLGGKVFKADADEPWVKEHEIGNEYLTLSATTRKTRWK